MSDTLWVATRKGLFTVSRASDGKWAVSNSAFLGDHVSMVLPAGDGQLYAGLYHGHFGSKLHRSMDAGKSWAECATPSFPERPPDAPADISPLSQQEVPWKLIMIWALETGGPDQPELLWCGTIPGGLFQSSDRGDSWELVRSLWDHPLRREWFGGGMDYPGIHSVCVDPRDSRRVTVGVSCGGVWVTEDGGGSWNCRADGMWAAYMPPERKNDPQIQDPHCIVQCHSNPDVMWTQHHNGVFRTVDGAANWYEIENVPPSTFGFAVAVHPEDPDTAWFVPGISDEHRIPVDGKVVVSRTNDGGKSFEMLRNGLPQQHAYDLTFRHALDVDETGNRLAFGSTTGSLWVTENGADTWASVSTHLPPVYCVRFVK